MAVRATFCVAVAWATYQLAFHTLDGRPWQTAIAALVAGAAVVQVWGVLGHKTPLHRATTHKVVQDLLLSKLVDWYRDGHFRDCDITQVSLHAWEVPAWYRRAVPFTVRRWLKEQVSDSVHERLRRRPPLVRAGYQRFAPDAGPSRVKFRKGVGLVGLSLETNDPARASFVDFESAEFQLALTSAEAWKCALPTITCGLRFEQAKRLADKYGQAVAIVIQDKRSKEAIGCLTMEVPHRWPNRLVTQTSILKELGDLAALLGDNLRLRPSHE